MSRFSILLKQYKDNVTVNPKNCADQCQCSNCFHVRRVQLETPGGLEINIGHISFTERRLVQFVSEWCYPEWSLIIRPLHTVKAEVIANSYNI